MKIVAPFGRRANQAEMVDDATLEFSEETSVAVTHPDSLNALVRRPAQILAVTLLITGMGAAVYWADRLKVPTAPPTGSLRIETDSPGAEVRVDGSVRGKTPLSLTLTAGKHDVVVQFGSTVKQLPVMVTTGEVAVHHITATEMPAPAPAVVGSLSVSTDTPGGQVSIDGEDRGALPLTVRNLAPGQHRVVVKSGAATYTRTVSIEAGSTASLVLSGNGVATWGWLSVTSPIAVQLYEGERLIGTSDIDRIMLPGGDHELDLVAESVGYRAARRVKVAASQTTTLTVDMPKTPVSINAIPWAEVTIDGTRLGETPLANVSIALGSHEIVFRHPQLGERRLTSVITLKGANRVSIDMRSR